MFSDRCFESLKNLSHAFTSCTEVETLEQGMGVGMVVQCELPRYEGLFSESNGPVPPKD